MSSLIKNIILLKLIWDTAPLIWIVSNGCYKASSYILSLTHSKVKKEIEKCKCLHCEDFRHRFNYEPAKH